MANWIARSLFAGLFLASTGAWGASAQYTIDTAHTEVGFGISHLTISTVKGRFNKFEGKFMFDETKNDLTDVDVKIDVTSIDTNEKKRDEHLVSPDFFDIKKYPTITFKSKKIEKANGKPAKLIGTLTLRGKKKDVPLDLVYKGTIVDPMGTHRVGFAATGKINRKDFGMTFNKTLDKGGLMIGEEVTLHIEGEAIRAASKAAKN